MHDLGTYVFMFANWVLPSLQVVAACGQDHPSGVTGQFSALLTDRSGRQAVVHSTVLTNTPVQAFVAGSAATLALDGPFYQPGGFEVRFTDGEALRYNEPATSHHALFWQAAEVARCVTSGLTSSSLRPPADSIATLALMDATRRLLRTAS